MYCYVVERPPRRRTAKIALFCNVGKDCVIPALNVDTIYNVPRAYHEEVWMWLLNHFGMFDKAGEKVDLSNGQCSYKY